MTKQSQDAPETVDAKAETGRSPVKSKQAACCGPVEQTSCCAPSEKAACCGDSHSEGCGCR